MRISKLTSNSISPVKAMVTKGTVQDKLYYNIKHGSIGDTLWMWTASLSHKFFKPDSVSDILELAGDNYFIRPIRSDGKTKQDGKGNLHYTITLDYMDHHKNDVMLLWEIPNKHGCDNITYELSGMVSELGKGYTGRERNKVVGRAPAPILEITGDCTLSWVGTAGNKKYTQTINYIHGNANWDIQTIEMKDIQC